MDSDVRRWLRAAKAQGFDVRDGGGVHVRVTAPDGRWTTVGRGAVDSRRKRNIRADLRRIGLDFGDREAGAGGREKKR